MNDDLAIHIRGLRKTYGDFDAVAGVDLDVKRGEVFALLGPNGAGKTTTVEILEGHRTPTAGEVRVLGHEPAAQEAAFKERIGIVLQETSVEHYLSVEETIELFRGYYPHPRPVDEVLDLVGLRDQRAMRVKKLSGGQQRRLDVAIGLAGDPDLLFLDEPTTGFDPAARRSAWEMVRGLQALGKTIFLTTHYMDEAEHLAERVAIIKAGRVIAEGPPGSLINAGTTRIRFRLPEANDPILAGIGNVTDRDGYALIETQEPTRVLYLLTSRARECGADLEELTVTHGSLEEAYLRLVGEPELVEA